MNRVVQGTALTFCQESNGWAEVRILQVKTVKTGSESWKKDEQGCTVLTFCQESWGWAEVVNRWRVAGEKRVRRR